MMDAPERDAQTEGGEPGKDAGGHGTPACGHGTVTCLNQYDTIRKYRCVACAAIFICECEQALALAFLPHQVRFASEYAQRTRIRVTGFASRMCAECRGEKEATHPRAAIHGVKGKVERFYWREIFKTECALISEWLSDRSESVTSILEFNERHPDVARELSKRAKEYWQRHHKRNPKYDLSERTEAAFLQKVAVPIVLFDAPYIQLERGKQRIGRWLTPDGTAVGVEELIGSHYRSLGSTVLRCERTLISVWVATFLAHVIQDDRDPVVQPIMRRSTRRWRSDSREGAIIRTLLPLDFGSEAFFLRRQGLLEEALSALDEAEDAVDVFDTILPVGESLRDYLWFANEDVVETARTALRVLPRQFVVEAIRWAIQNFWQRQHGWPDLLVYDASGYRFVEVKSPHDQLSLEQMRWFEWAVDEVKVPCQIVRVRRTDP